MKTGKRILKYFSIVLVIVFGTILFMLSRQIAGYRAFVVMSASMEPAIKTGSLIITERVNPHMLIKQDVVTFIRPDNTKEFITHRIVSVSKPQNIPLFTTKGDNNESPDTWTLVGGGVVGKVMYTIPHLGYLLSIARTKIGIALLILLPALFIILDEIMVIYHLIKHRKKISPSKTQTMAMVLVLVGIAPYIISTPSRAILADSVSLTDNTVTISDMTPTQTPTPTSTPAPTGTCPPVPDSGIEGNGAGSTNTIIINQTCTTVIEQTNHSSTSTTVVVTTNTEDNTVF